MTAKSLWHIDGKRTEIRQEDMAQVPGKPQILKSDYSLISTGTERLVATGRVPTALHAAMRVPYMGGQFHFPVKYGYSLVASAEGRHYHLMHPHQDAVAVAPADTYLLSSGTPKHRGTLISNMETALNAVWDAGLAGTESLAICGFGNIGSLLATTLRTHWGKEASILELDDWRSQKAEALGWKVETEGKASYDVVFHTSATAKGLQNCLSRLNPEGRVVELSWYGDQRVSLELGTDFHYKRLGIIASQVSQIPLGMQPDMTFLKRKQLAEKILQHPDFDDLLTDFIPFKQAPTFFHDLRAGHIRNGLLYLLEY